MSENKKTPFFSIIVPVYKTEQYIHQCLDSILSQTYSNFEAILVDDGSPDNCGSICDEYAARDSRIRVVHKQNGGLVSARKAGLAESSGEYIVNVDSDDYIETDLLEQLSQVAEKHQPEAVLYNIKQFSQSDVSPLKNLLPDGFYSNESIKLIRQNLINNNKAEQVILYNLCAMCVKKEKYFSFQNSVPQGISIGEDLAVSAPMLASCSSIYMLDYFGYYYRYNPTSIMNTFNVNEISQIKQLLSHLSASLGSEYEQRLNIYALTHYFSFIDRGIANLGYKEYRKLIKNTYDKELFSRIQNATCNGNLKTRVLFTLIKSRCFTILWILRKIQRPYK